MIRTVFLVVLLSRLTTTLSAQVYQPVFSGLTGPALTDSVVGHYKPFIVLDYANARDTLYAKVLALDDDSLRCIYSGHTLYLDPTQDPTQYIYLNGGPLGMNTEHAYPQSKGAADGNPRSDMHHLFPARIPVNEARGDVPFAEIPDAQTQKWFRLAQVLTSTPVLHKDEYSEFKAGQFEPRESVKGDIARAIFYFYTMYRSQADAADPAFFNQQRATLCLWHDQDAADSAELIKTWRIAPYQENKPNPFILDCTLARRLYCPELAANCASTAASEPGTPALGLRLSPNPMAGAGRLEMTLPVTGRLDVHLRSMLGEELANWQVPEAEAGLFRLALDTRASVAAQTAILEVQLFHAGGRLQQSILVFLQ
ncbi:MAG: endonuclease [Saprospiraceae bacterium]|nr:endonuclease [Saprospiraceae bacterium]